MPWYAGRVLLFEGIGDRQPVHDEE
jgi:hypothetical protein